VDVKIGPTQVGQIKIRDHDNPVKLARNFGRIYGLDEIACTVLASATRQSMLSHGIEAGDADDAAIDKEIASLQSFSGDDDSSYEEDSNEGSYFDDDEESDYEYS
jgi:hypothetical protein